MQRLAAIRVPRAWLLVGRWRTMRHAAASAGNHTPPALGGAAGRRAFVRDRLTLIHQDMSELSLGRRFGLVFVSARSFRHLLMIEPQKKSLEAIHRHLEPTGRLALHVFDPRLDLLIDPNTTVPVLSGTHSETGRCYVGEVLRSNFDHVNQVRRDLWRYTEKARWRGIFSRGSRDGPPLTYRRKPHHLLRLCGLVVEAEHSDFDGSAPCYGKELILGRTSRVIFSDAPPGTPFPLVAWSEAASSAAFHFAVSGRCDRGF